MSKTYYAVCDANGPISHKLEATTLAEAIAEFEAANSREWIDNADTDAEDDLDIAGDDMSEDEFAAALEEAGCVQAKDVSLVVVGQGPTLRADHLAGGWVIWQHE